MLWYLAALEYTQLYNAHPRVPCCTQVSHSLWSCASAALLVVLGLLHVLVLDVLPLSLPSALAPIVPHAI
jgi:hypothetical protein